MKSICSKKVATFTANNIKFSLCLFSQHFFSVSIFGNGDETNIPFTDNPMCTTLWMSAGMQRALKIAHLVPTVQWSSETQRVPSRQWLFITYIPPKKQPSRPCFGSQHFTHRAVRGQSCPPPWNPQVWTQISLGLQKEWPPKGVVVLQPDLNGGYQLYPLVFLPSGRRGSLLALHRALCLFLQREEHLWKWGVVSALLKAELGPVYLTFQHRKSASTISI